MSHCEANLHGFGCKIFYAKYFNIKPNFFLEGIHENKLMENMILEKLFNKMSNSLY